MIEKPLELITEDTCPIQGWISIPTEESVENTLYQCIKESNRVSISSRQSFINKLIINTPISIPYTINVLGVDIDINLFSYIAKEDKFVGIIKNKYPKIWKKIEKNYNPNFIDIVNNTLQEQRNNYKSKVQKQFDELYEIHKKLNYKSDLVKLDEINTLLYCEAEVLLDKIEEKINKKSTAKSIRLYKALMKLRNKEIIECNG